MNQSRFVYVIPGRPDRGEPAILRIGETGNLAARRVNYLSQARNGYQDRTSRWIRQNGADAFQLVPYAQVDGLARARELEALLVRTHRPPLNATADGGPGGNPGNRRPARRGVVVDVTEAQPYPTVAAASRATGISESAIAKACRRDPTNPNGRAGGRSWRYLEDLQADLLAVARSA